METVASAPRADLDTLEGPAATEEALALISDQLDTLTVTVGQLVQLLAPLQALGPLAMRLVADPKVAKMLGIG